MTESYSFFGGTPDDPRQYNQTEFAEVLERLFRNGYFPGVDSELVVSPTDPARLAVRVGAGQSWINGYWYKNDSWKEIDLAAADGSNARIDRIVLRLDTVNARNIEAIVKTGTPASSPTAPGLERTDQIYEISLATVRVNSGATSITAGNITDTREDENVCGQAVPWNVALEDGNYPNLRARGTTKADVGLGNLINERQATKAEFDAHTDDNTRHITASERSNWNEKETPQGAQDKASSARDAAISWVQDFGLGGPGELVNDIHGDSNNFNMFTKPGTFTTSGNYVNGPLGNTTHTGIIQIAQRNVGTNGVWQRWVHHVTTSTFAVYERYNSNPPNEVGDWVLMYHSGNLDISPEADPDTIMKRDSQGDASVNTLKAADRVIVGGTDVALQNGSYANLRARATTKTDVGLSEVSNYPVASQSDARSGTSGNHYMTPQRVRQAIESLGLWDGLTTGNTRWSDMVGTRFVWPTSVDDSPPTTNPMGFTIDAGAGRAFQVAARSGRMFFRADNDITSNPAWFELWHSGNAEGTTNTNGYQIFPSGVVMQWGSQVVSSGDVITFPIAFPNVMRQVVAVINDTTPGAIAVQFAPNQSTGFLVNHDAGDQVNIRFLAIGH